MSEKHIKNQPADDKVSIKDSTVAQLLLNGQREQSRGATHINQTEVMDLSKRRCNNNASTGNFPHTESVSQKSKTKVWKCRYCPFTTVEALSMYKHYQLHQVVQGKMLRAHSIGQSEGSDASESEDQPKAPTIKTLLMRTAVYYPAAPSPSDFTDHVQHTETEAEFKDICISDDESVLNGIYTSGDTFESDNERSLPTKRLKLSEKSFVSPFQYNYQAAMIRNKSADIDESESDDMRHPALNRKFDTGDIHQSLLRFNRKVKVEPQGDVRARLHAVDAAVQCNLLKIPPPSILGNWLEGVRTSSPSLSDRCIVGSSDSVLGDVTRDQLQHRCNDCGITFDDDVLYTLHRGCHSHSDPFICNICGVHCGNKYAFYTHILRGHNTC